MKALHRIIVCSAILKEAWGCFICCAPNEQGLISGLGVSRQSHHSYFSHSRLLCWSLNQTLAFFNTNLIFRHFTVYSL